jgi:hypothetical protein
MLSELDHKQTSDPNCPQCGSNMALREVRRGLRAGVVALRPLELDYLRRMDVAAGANFREQFFARRGVEI